MTLLVCLDDDDGMMFNNRRQSKDCIVRRRILELVGDSSLWMSEYSLKQFEEPVHVVKDKNLAEYIFAETSEDIEGISFEKVIVFRWNRRYPGDMFWSPSGRQLVSTMEYPGNSHELITEETYE